MVVMISDDFQSLITRLSVLMLFALSLLYIEYSIHSSYKKIFIFPERNILFFCHSVHTSKGSSRRSEKIIKSWWWWGPLLLLPRLPLTPQPPAACAVVWLALVNQEIALAISNPFFAVFCIAVHIPDLIQTGQKTQKSALVGWSSQSKNGCIHFKLIACWF